ncbi:PAS domain-containing protein, partial [bacterium]|nr:PAS domain-containing protein [bacterium]
MVEDPELNRLRAMLDAVPGFVSWVSSEGKYLGVNKALAESLGKPAASIIGHELGFQRSEHKFIQFVREFIDGTKSYETKEMEIPQDGTIKHFLIVAKKYRQNQDAVFVSIDISQLKKAQTEIHTLHQFQEMVIDNADVLICFIN